SSLEGGRRSVVRMRATSDASTAENARSTGTPAATNAPNASSRMANVSGNDMFSARVKSFPIVPLSAWSALAPPNSAAELRMRALLRRDRVEDRLDALVGGVAV